MAARLQIVIEADDKARATIVNLDEDLRRLGVTADNTGGPIDALGNSWQVAAGLVVAGGVAIIGALGYAASRASEFEVAMDGVAAVSSASADDMARLSGLALQLGQDTRYSALQAAQGLEELVKGGVGIPDILDGAAAAMLNLAAAGGVDLPTAATIAANAMNQFGLAGADMARVADLIAGAANASSLDVNDFAQSLQMGGAVAKLAGVSFDDFAVAVGLMGKAGIVGSDAGTSLKTMFMNLEPTTKKAISLFTDLGIITEDGANQLFDATGKVKSLADVSGILQTAMAGLTKQQQLTALEVMFGTDAIRAAAIMASAGAAGFDDMAAAMGKVSAADVARIRMDNLAGSIEQAKGAMDTLAITVGLAVTPMLKEFVDVGLIPVATTAIGMANTLIRDLTPAAVAFGATVESWMPTVSAISTTIREGLLWSLNALTGILGDYAGPAIAATATVLGLVLLPMLIAVTGAAWAAALPWMPLVLVLVAVGAAVFALGVAYQENLFGIRDTTEAVMAYITPAITEGFAYVVNWTQENWPLIQRTVGAVMAATKQYIEIITTVISALWTEWGDEITATAKWTWEMVSTIVGTLLGTMFDQITFVMQAITGDWDGAHESMRRIAARGSDAIGTIWTLLGQALTAIVSAATTTMVNQWDIWKNQMIAIVDAMTLPMRQKTEQWLSGIAGAINAAFAAGGNVLSSVSSMASTIVSTLGSGIEGGVSAIRDKVRDTTTSAVDQAKDLVAAASNIATFATKVTDDIGANIVLGGVTIKNKIVSTVSTAITDAATGLTGFVTLGKSVIDGITGQIAEGSGAIGTAIKSAINSAISGFNAATSSLSFNLGSVIVPGIGEVTFPTIGPLNLPDMPYLANGGIVTGPTVAMLGDNPSRREAIIPLERAGEMGFGGNTYNVTVQGPLRRDVEPRDMLRAMRKLDLLYGAG